MHLISDRGFFFTQVNKPAFQIPDAGAKKLENNKIARDGREWHMTIIDPKENKGFITKYARENDLSKDAATKELKNRLIKDFNKIQVPPEYVGVGKVEKDNNVAYFVIVDWPEAQEFRASYGLNPKDFHVTLGFGEKGDIHGVSKDRSTLINNNLLYEFITSVLSEKKRNKSKLDDEEDKEKKDDMRDLSLRAYWDQLY